MIDKTPYTVLSPRSGSYWLWLLGLIALVILGGYAALTMEHAGHIITGMTNHVVWGLPHVFAVSLIVAASGALNGASLSSVFGQTLYKPYARLSVALAMSLLIGGLIVLVLDLGRPDRLIVAMTTYNFRSIFAWNIFLYTGFVAIGALYLWFMVERRFNRYTKAAGTLAFAWRIVLTTGTGSIFGFLVGRDALDSALLAPLFIALSLVMGTAAYALVLKRVETWQNDTLPDALPRSLSRLQVWFLVALVYFSIVHHLTNLYAVEHHAVERFTLAGPMAATFWLGHIGIGVLLPLAVLLWGGRFSLWSRLMIASVASLVGGAFLVYAIIVGSQSQPQRMFPGKVVVDSRFGDAGFAPYQASIWEWGLGIGGVALALLLCLIVLRVFPFTPLPRAASPTPD